MRIEGIVLASLLWSGTAIASPPPDAVRAMIDTALASKDPATVSAVVAVAKRAMPDSIVEIEAMVADYNKDLAAKVAARKQAELARRATASIFSLWTGQLEVGGSWSTGNTRAFGVYGNVKIKREGLNWQHDLTAHVDYQQTNGVPTTERIIAAYQPRYKLNPASYVYAIEQYEHDRFLGYRDRLTTGVGMGVVAVDRPNLRLEFDAGPAIRYTSFYEEPQETRLAGRGSFHFKWQPFPTLTIGQDAALYLQTGNTTASSTTSIDTLLFGPLKGRLSYNVQYESDVPTGQKNTDTVSRASLVYSF